MTDHDPLTLDDMAFTADVTIFLKALARIMARVLGERASRNDNQAHEAEHRGPIDKQE